MNERARIVDGGGWPDRVKIEVDHKPWADAFLMATAAWFIPTAIWGIARFDLWEAKVLFPAWTDWFFPLVQLFLLILGVGFYFFEKPEKAIVERSDPSHPPYNPRNLY